MREVSVTLNENAAVSAYMQHKLLLMLFGVKILLSICKARNCKGTFETANIYEL
jgi:hypothetical protein